MRSVMSRLLSRHGRAEDQDLAGVDDAGVNLVLEPHCPSHLGGGLGRLACCVAVSLAVAARAHDHRGRGGLARQAARGGLYALAPPLPPRPLPYPPQPPPPTRA